jgi:hypothetical protein
MHCTDVYVHRVKISEFKLKMTYSNHSIYSLYQTLVENQILYFFEIFLLFFYQDKVARGLVRNRFELI